MVLGRILGAFAKGVKAIGSYVNPTLRFLGKYHAPLTQVAHGLAMSSNNATAQKITGLALAASNMATLRGRLNEGNARVAQAMADNGGKPGDYNHTTSTLR